MIYYFTPYSTSKNFFEAIDAQMNCAKPNDWICLIDGDTMFLYSDFGHKLQKFTELYPDTGLFTCVSNRCHYECQRYEGVLSNESDILHHHQMAHSAFEKYGYRVKEVKRRIAGHLMMIKASTWMQVRKDVEAAVKTQNKKVLGVDTKISNAMIKRGLKIRIMEGFYLFHFLRLNKSVDDNKHLI